MPGKRTLSNKLNELGNRLRKVNKCKPLKQIPQIDAIFDAVHQNNEAVDQTLGVLRISLDNKVTIKVGPFSCGGLH